MVDEVESSTSTSELNVSDYLSIDFHTRRILGHYDTDRTVDAVSVTITITIVATVVVLAV